MDTVGLVIILLIILEIYQWIIEIYSDWIISFT
jgi:hypothetical protein